MGSAVNVMDILRHPTLKTGLLSFFPFEGNANDVHDSHNGTVNGATQVVGTRYNKLAYTFNGSSYYITLGTHADFEAVNIALSAWAYPTATTASKKIVAKRNDTTIQWALQVNATNPRWEFTIKIAGSVYTVTDTVNFVASNWYHLVGTYDGAYVRLYVNGLEVGTPVAITGSISSSATMPVLFGARCANGATTPGADYFSGTIDEPGIWSRGLTEDEVRDMYSGGNGLEYNNSLPKYQYVPFQLEGVSTYENQPRVEGVAASSQNTVRVYFDQGMRCSNPGSLVDALNPTNYAIATFDGIPRAVSSVTLLNSVPTIVDLVLDGEMTNGKSYSCTVTSVVNIVGNVINESYNARSFTGWGVAPHVSSAQALDFETIKIVFNEEMLNTADLRALSSYHFSGPTTLTPTWVTVFSPTEVRVAVSGEMLNAAAYSVSVGFPPSTGIQDIAWNNLDEAYHTESFSGIGIPPQVLPAALPKGAQQVWVKFNEEVETISAETKTNYVIMGGAPPAPLVVTNAIKLDATTVRLDTDIQTSALLYTITVSNVTDMVGNAVQPPTNQATFLGVGYTPPRIEFVPVDGATGVEVRTRLKVHIYDDRQEFTGVNRSSIWVRISYTEGGVVQTHYAVYAGDLQLGFVGEVTGDPLTYDGLTYYLRLTVGWPENTRLTINAYAEDVEGSSSGANEIHFTTGLANCFEDNLPMPSELDTKLLSSLSPFENAEKLRRLLLECCTQSFEPQVRARTLMYLAAVTDMRTFLATGFDFGQVEDVMLCERNSMLSIHQKMAPYLKFAHLAVDNLTKFSPEAKALLHKYLNGNSPVYVVNAVALAVVLTAIWEV